MIRVRERKREGVELNISPLIDLVFLLLIFFITTTSFVKQMGVDINRPVAKTAQKKEANLLIGIDREGRVFVGDREVDLDSLRAHVERFLAENPGGAVLVVADKSCSTGVLIRVLDECRMAGARRISVAASRK